MKNGVNWGNGFSIADTDTKHGPLKCLIFQINEENFTFVTFKTNDSIKWKLVYSIISFLRWDFTFQVTRAIKLPISAGDWHFLVARFSKNQVYLYKLKTASRVLSRIYRLGEKSRVAQCHELLSGVRGHTPPEIFWNEYALRCNLVHFETQFCRVRMIFPI